MPNESGALRRCGRVVFSLSLAFVLMAAGCGSDPAVHEPPAEVAAPVHPVTQDNFNQPEESGEPNVAAMLREKRCHLCHADSGQLLGPSYESIGLEYRDRRDTMIDALAEKIVNGGAGNWGAVPMVPSGHVSLDEARTMARWILDFAPR